MTEFNDKNWSVSVGEKSWSAREWPDWCHERNIKFDWDWTEHKDYRGITMYNMYFESEADYILFKLAWA
jgi:hypothetical protein